MIAVDAIWGPVQQPGGASIGRAVDKGETAMVLSMAVIDPSSSLGFLVIVGAGVLGLLIGSFLNVVVYRLPLGLSLNHPGSHCPSCKTALHPWENIPVLSWICLRGRCRTCHVRISPRYVVVESVTGLSFGLSSAIVWQLGTKHLVWIALIPILAGVTAMAITGAAMESEGTPCILRLALMVALPVVALVAVSIIGGEITRLAWSASGLSLGILSYVLGGGSERSPRIARALLLGALGAVSAWLWPASEFVGVLVVVLLSPPLYRASPLTRNSTHEHATGFLATAAMASMLIIVLCSALVGLPAHR
jgi:leader peptidase (prepilin peptidase)/N-methyltransferase